MLKPERRIRRCRRYQYRYRYHDHARSCPAYCHLAVEALSESGLGLRIFCWVGVSRWTSFDERLHI